MMQLRKLFSLCEYAKKDNSLVTNHLQNDVLKDFLEHKKEIEYLYPIVENDKPFQHKLAIDLAMVNDAIAFYSQINKG